MKSSWKQRTLADLGLTSAQEAVLLKAFPTITYPRFLNLQQDVSSGRWWHFTAAKQRRITALILHGILVDEEIYE